MKVLAIESSSVVAGTALLDGEQVIYEGYSHNKLNHSQILMPLVEEALSAGDIKAADVDLYAISKGPGSFTGLRIGISTVKGLAMAFNKPIAAIPTLDLLACNFPFYSGYICPVMDARREQVYTALYKWDRNDLIQLEPYKASRVSELIEKARQYDEPILFTGDGVKPYKAAITENLRSKAIFAPPNLRHQRASAAAWLATSYFEKNLCISYRDLEPFYLRQSQAEQKMLMKQKGRSVDD